MAIIPSGIWPIDPTVTNGTELAQYLNDWVQAFGSQHANASRPPMIARGGVWAKTLGAADIALMLYDGTTDHEIGKIIGGNASFGGGTNAGATAPTSPAAGAIWFDTAAKVLNVYDGANWTPVSKLTPLTLDAVNNRVGINQATPTGQLHVGASDLFVDPTGNVGIGTNAPTASLQVHLNSAGYTTAKLSNSVTGSGVLDGFDLVCGTKGEAYITNRENQQIIIGTNNVGVMRVDAAGAVGIGVSSPDSFPGKLVVNNGADRNTVVRGSVRLTGSTIQSLQNNGSTDSPLEIYAGSAQLQLEGSPITFYNGGEKARIDASGNVGIGTSSPDASAILDAQSKTKGVRMPNMSTAEKNAIASPAAGLMVFDTTLSKLCVYTGAGWETITSV